LSYRGFFFTEDFGHFVRIIFFFNYFFGKKCFFSNNNYLKKKYPPPKVTKLCSKETPIWETLGLIIDIFKDNEALSPTTIDKLFSKNTPSPCNP
jgi:hypothetical protein